MTCDPALKVQIRTPTIWEYPALSPSTNFDILPMYAITDFEGNDITVIHHDPRRIAPGQGWGEYWTYEYEYWKISTRVVLEYNVFSIFMFIILGKTSTWVVLAPALHPEERKRGLAGQIH